MGLSTVVPSKTIPELEGLEKNMNKSLDSAKTILEMDFLSETLADTENVTYIYNCKYSHYQIDPDNKHVVFNETLPAADVQTIDSNAASVIIEGSRFVGDLSSIDHKLSSIKIPTGDRVNLVDQYPVPSISLVTPELESSSRLSQTKLQIGRNEYSLRSGEVSRITLPEMEVDVRLNGAETGDLIEYDRPESDETQRVHGTGDIESVSISPTMIVRNIGQVDVKHSKNSRGE